jgi:hypothetical protein
VSIVRPSIAPRYPEDPLRPCRDVTPRTWNLVGLLRVAQLTADRARRAAWPMDRPPRRDGQEWIRCMRWLRVAPSQRKNAVREDTLDDGAARPVPAPSPCNASTTTSLETLLPAMHVPEQLAGSPTDSCLAEPVGRRSTTCPAFPIPLQFRACCRCTGDAWSVMIRRWFENRSQAGDTWADPTCSSAMQEAFHPCHSTSRVSTKGTVLWS